MSFARRKITWNTGVIFLSTYICSFIFISVAYGPFFDHVLGYWRARENPKILFVAHEDLHQNPAKIIRQIAEFLEVSYVQESFVSMKFRFKKSDHEIYVNL